MCEALWGRQRAAHAGPIADVTLLYRVEFHVVATQ
jgi:hypothetical protein